MNNIILISLVHVGFLVTVPFATNALDSQPVSQNFEGKMNVLISQDRPSYQRGYTPHSALQVLRQEISSQNQLKIIFERFAISKIL